jgi:hypothetical protein
MTEHERGAYSPHNEGPLAFDARQSSGGGRGFPTTLVISLVVLAVLIVAIVLFYRSGIRGAADGPAPVGTPVAQIKAPAPSEAQPSDEATGLQIYKTEGAPESSLLAAPTFAAPPEQPKPRPTAPVAAKPPPTAPIVSANAAAASGSTTAPQPTPPAQPAVQHDEIGALLDKSAAATAAKPASPKPATAPAPVAVGPASAQIGAYSSEALAAKGWSDIASAFSGDMSGKGKHFEPVTKDGKTLYRAAVTGFASKASAQAFCAKLKAAGHACIVK